MNKITYIFLLFFLFTPSNLVARYTNKPIDNYFVCIHVDKKSEKLTTVDRVCKPYDKNDEYFTITREHLVLPYDIKHSVKCKSGKEDIRCNSIFFTISKSETIGYTTGKVLALPFVALTLPLGVLAPKETTKIAKKTASSFITTFKHFDEKRFESFVAKNSLLRFRDILKKEAEVVALYPSAKERIEHINLNRSTKSIKNKIDDIRKELYKKRENTKFVLTKIEIFKQLYPFAKNPLKDIDLDDNLQDIKSHIATIEKKLQNKKRELIAKAKRDAKIRYIQKEKERIKKLYQFTKNPLKDINLNSSLADIRYQVSLIEKKLITKKNAIKKRKHPIQKTKVTTEQVIKKISQISKKYYEKRKNEQKIKAVKTKTTNHIKHRPIKITKTKTANHTQHKTIKKIKKENKNITTFEKHHTTFGEYLKQRLPIFFVILFLFLYIVSPKKTDKKRGYSHQNSSKREYQKKENNSNSSKQSNNSYKNPNSIEYACEVLGISINDSNESIKKAHKTLVKKYHPDIIAGKGLGEDFIKLATEKLQEINSAYDIVKKYKNIR